MNDLHVSPAVRYVGADDTSIDLFESQYPVPHGVSYNSYVILDEKTAVLDTVDRRATAEWLDRVAEQLSGRKPDYLVLHHLEPDHAGSAGAFLEKYPDVTVVGNAKTFTMLSKYYAYDDSRTVTVKEGDTLSLGGHVLTFVMAPMVHWPEVMVSYESSEKILFSADGFGTFGALSANRPWIEGAARYYFNIVGKYGASVQALLKKAAGLDIQTICPLHGPVLREDLGYYVGKYDQWSRYEPESEGAVVAFASIHGNTAQAAKLFAEILREKGCAEVHLFDLSREDQALAVERAFRCRRLALLSATYDGGLFPAMDHFLAHLRDKTWRGRKAALVENGSWAPSAARHMRTYLEAMKDITVCPTVHTLQGALKDSDRPVLERIAEELLAD